jgi:hypothetical protein
MYFLKEYGSGQKSLHEKNKGVAVIGFGKMCFVYKCSSTTNGSINKITEYFIQLLSLNSGKICKLFTDLS